MGETCLKQIKCGPTCCLQIGVVAYHWCGAPRTPALGICSSIEACSKYSLPRTREALASLFLDQCRNIVTTAACVITFS